MTGKQTRGAVAGGSPLTVEAGLEALRAGGNAVDAAVAASLMACVAEPLLTGLGGAGLATIRMNGRVEVLDLFADVPGLSMPAAETRPMRVVEIDFGPTTQVFHVGAASVAVPGVPKGLAALHARWGRVPLSRLAAPAVAAATSGVPVSQAFERVLGLLWPIVSLHPVSAARFGNDGRPLKEGDTFRWPELGETLRRFAAEGPSLLHDGPLGRAMVSALGGDSRLGRADLENYSPRFTRALRYRYRDATVWVPGPPSVAGLLVLQALRALEDHGPMPPPLGARQVRYLEHAMGRVDHTRKHGARKHLFDPGFVEGFLSAIAPDEVGEEYVTSGHRPPSTGHTTHISTVDEDGNAVGITTSLGESCGVPVPEAGLLLNNFLGEADVNPEDVLIGPGQRLMTMCCPTIVEIGDEVYVMGSGGSSRIRSAILHGIVYLTDHGMSPDQVVAAPRAHVEEGVLHLETEGRPPGAVQAARTWQPQLRAFTGSNMFFGGLHMAGCSPRGFSGAGDQRRSGAFGKLE